MGIWSAFSNVRCKSQARSGGEPRTSVSLRKPVRTRWCEVYLMPLLPQVLPSHSMCHCLYKCILGCSASPETDDFFRRASYNWVL